MRAWILTLLVAAATPLNSAAAAVSGNLGRPDDKSEMRVEYEAITAEFGKEMGRYGDAMRAMQVSDEFKKALDDSDATALNEMMSKIARPNAEGFAVRMLALVEQHLGNVDTIDALLWILSAVPTPEYTDQALETLLDGFANSEDILPFAQQLYRLGRSLGMEKVIASEAALSTNPSMEVRAHALYGRAQTILNSKQATDEQKAAAQEDLQRVIEMAPESSCALRINAAKFKEERLQIGMVAPDIEGSDFDGVDFKLSDYRGKVVVLDFWGDW